MARDGDETPQTGTRGSAATRAFSFEIDTRRRLLTVTKRGYWEMATFYAFADEFRLTLRRMALHGGCRYCLVDASDYAVQSAPVTRALQQLVGSFPADCPERMAGVTGSKLSELQARHAGAAPNRQVFPSRKAAEAWLFSIAAASPAAILRADAKSC